ncbi:inhibitor of apoptosis-promoting Bax1-domain-containing protein [Chytriomyces cf. hyalinus JEL632]|nr:inhibitor of apoptosis-promoting Bax1-domain-containing protein [Chytriomyces cf. hyalinus JEL632]
MWLYSCSEMSVASLRLPLGRLAPHTAACGLVRPTPCMRYSSVAAAPAGTGKAKLIVRCPPGELIQPSQTRRKYGWLQMSFSVAAVAAGAYLIDQTFNQKEELLDGQVHSMYSHIPDNPIRSIVRSNDTVREYLNETYLFVGLGVALTGGSAYLLHFNKAFQRVMLRNPVGVTLGAMAASAMIAPACLMTSSENKAGKYTLFSMFAVSKGVFLTSAIIVSPALIAHAGLYTAGLLASLSFIGATTKSDNYVYLGGPLLGGLTVSAIAANTSIILPLRLQRMPKLLAFYLYSGLTVFGYYVLGDMQKVIKSGRAVEVGTKARDPVNEALRLYLDFMSILP